MCYVTATELKKNLSHYLKLSQSEKVYITKNKRIVSIMYNPAHDSYDNLFSLAGCLKEYDDGRPYDEILAEALINR